MRINDNIMRLTALVLLVAISMDLASGTGTFLISPPTRSNQHVTMLGCEAPWCTGPCDATRPDLTTFKPNLIVQRGQDLDIQWTNGPIQGGFISLSILPTAQSDNALFFQQAIYKIVCSNSSCDTSIGGLCKTQVAIPSHLTDGIYTLRWFRFGGDQGMADHSSCSDFKIQGGVELTPPTMQPEPVFDGPRDGCVYYNSASPGKCVTTPCSDVSRGFYGNGLQQTGLPDIGTEFKVINADTSSTDNDDSGNEDETINPTATSSDNNATITPTSTNEESASQPLNLSQALPIIIGIVAPAVIAFIGFAAWSFRARRHKRKHKLPEIESVANNPKVQQSTMSVISIATNIDESPFSLLTKRQSSFIQSELPSQIVSPAINAKITLSALLSQAQLSAANVIVAPPGLFVYGLFDFQSRNSDEISFKKGDRVLITKVFDDGWCEGGLATEIGIAMVGMLPLNYVGDSCPINNIVNM